MRFYYTGAANFLAPQPVPSKSLGGFISSSLVPNDLLSNLFDLISYSDVTNPVQEIRAIALKNELGQEAKNINIWFEYPEDPLAMFEVGVVQPNVNDCDELFFEQIPNANASPYYVEFLAPNGESEKVNIGNLENGMYLGFWFRRTINTDSDLIKDLGNCNKLYEDFNNNNPLPTEETVKFILEWE